MNAVERTFNFIRGLNVDRVPFHPLVMQFAIKQSGVSHRDYFLDYRKQHDAMMHVHEQLGMDCIHVSGYPYCEAIEYGLEVEFPENDLPFEKDPLIRDYEKDIEKIRLLDIQNSQVMMNRVAGVRHYREQSGEKVFICGHFEGPLAEYCDLRDMSFAFMDFYDKPDQTKDVLKTIVKNSKQWAELQIKAGAHCMSMGDAACSQIGPDLYREFIFDLHKEIVEYVHSLGAMVKIHICGDITPILPMLIETGANIIDVDHLVGEMQPFIPLLGEEQVFCGNFDPVAVVQNGTPESIRNAVWDILDSTENKCIISAGCEIPRDTPVENYKAMLKAIEAYNGEYK